LYVCSNCTVKALNALYNAAAEIFSLKKILMNIQKPAYFWHKIQQQITSSYKNKETQELRAPNR